MKGQQKSCWHVFNNARSLYSTSAFLECQQQSQLRTRSRSERIFNTWSAAPTNTTIRVEQRIWFVSNKIGQKSTSAVSTVELRRLIVSNERHISSIQIACTTNKVGNTVKNGTSPMCCRLPNHLTGGSSIKFQERTVIATRKNVTRRDWGTFLNLVD